MLKSMSFTRWGMARPVLSLLCVLACAPPVRAQTNGDPLNPSMTVHLTGISFREALATMCRTTGMSFRLPADVAAKIDLNETYNIEVDDGKFQDGLNNLFEQVDPPLAFHLENGAYVLELSKTLRVGKAVKKPRAIYHTTYAEKDKSFEAALKHLFFFEHARYRIDPAVTAYLDPVTFSIDDATLDQKLTALLASIPAPNPPLTFRVEKGVYVIAPKDAPAKPSPLNAPIGLPSYNPQPMIKAVEIQDERPGAALEQMFAQAGVDYTFAQPASVVASPRLTFAMQGVPLEQAVVHLLRSAPTTPMLYLSSSDLNTLDFKPHDGTTAKHIVYSVAPGGDTFGAEPPTELRHWFSFHHTDLYAAFKCLMAGTHQNYAIDPATRAIFVTASGSNLSLEAAISKLLAASPVPMQSSTKDGILNIQAPVHMTVSGSKRP